MPSSLARGGIDILPRLKHVGFLTIASQRVRRMPFDRSLDGLTPTCQFVDAPTKNIPSGVDVPVVAPATDGTNPRPVS